MKVTYAVQIRYEDRTDIREEVGAPLDPTSLRVLCHLLRSGAATAVPGLLGWGTATHTLTEHECGGVYHARIEED